MSPSISTNLLARNAAAHVGEHYDRLATSMRRLSSGLRVNTAADDAAGLAIRELMRTNIAGLQQGVRNANDAISMIQTADGALSVIDEKLIRMTELAEQAATGTYDSTQRLIIDSEFQAMAQEIDRIANATDFNGIKLLDGSMNGEHDGSGLTSTGKMKVHFGTGNDSAEDYYYVEIADCTLAGLGLRDEAVTASVAVAGETTAVAPAGRATFAARASGYGNVPIFSDVAVPGRNVGMDRPPNSGTFGVLAIGIIPAGTTDFSFLMTDEGRNDTLQIFTRSGKHLAGTTLDRWTESPTPAVNVSSFMTEANGFLPSATYDGTELNGGGNNLSVDYTNQYPPLQNFTVNGMNIGYTGDGGDHHWPDDSFRSEKVVIDRADEDIILLVAGYDRLQFRASWSDMPGGTPGPGPLPPTDPTQPLFPDEPFEMPKGDIISIKTQEKAQQALERLDDAMVAKDGVRAHLGALQNRLENTVTNLSVQAENLQAAESRISDVDVAVEMTAMIRNQILAQSSTSMLAQANALPQMLVELIG